MIDPYEAAIARRPQEARRSQGSPKTPAIEPNAANPPAQPGSTSPAQGPPNWCDHCEEDCYACPFESRESE